MANETMIGHYKVLEQIGAGAMGAVRVGLDTYLDRPVAIKSLRSDFVNDPEFVSRFRSEAKSLARLNHQNIAALYTPIFEDGRLHLVMELVKGKSLEAVLAERGRPLGVKQALAIVAQACDGLGYAHEMGVIHRDVKPSNLMIGNDGRVKIMDFGIARVQGSVRLTRTGAAVGTPLYMSPEQCRGEEGDERSDIYSLGVVLYEMLKGAPPFSGKTDYDLIQAQIKTPPPPLIPDAPGVTPALEAAVMIALSKRPDQRFASMKAFGDALGATEVLRDATGIIRGAVNLVEDKEPADGARASTLDVAQSRTRSMLRALRAGGIGLSAVLGLVVAALGGGLGYLYMNKPAARIVEAKPRPAYSAAAIVAPPPSPATASAVAAAETPPPAPSTVAAVETPAPSVAPAAETPSAATPKPVAAAAPPPPAAAAPEASPSVAPAAAPAPAAKPDDVNELRMIVRGSPNSRIRAADFEYLSNAAKVGLLPKARAVAATGSAEAQFVYGMLLLVTPGHTDVQGAFQALSDAAAQDYPDAQVNLAMMYQRKNMLASGQDLGRARFWFAKAAEKGDAKARFWLGCYNEFGWGGATVDKQRAALDFGSASDGGYELARAALNALNSGDASASPCLR
jgi:serine/threonine-protein kinase